MPEAERCWGEKGNYTCVNVRGIGEHTTVKKIFYKSLPSNAQRYPDSTESAYSCGYSTLMGTTIDERISKGDALLLENTVKPPIGENRKPWRKGYVLGFLRDNKLKSEEAYFECLRIVDVIRDGSLESLGTTLLAKSALD